MVKNSILKLIVLVLLVSFLSLVVLAENTHKLYINKGDKTYINPGETFLISITNVDTSSTTDVLFKSTTGIAEMVTYIFTFNGNELFSESNVKRHNQYSFEDINEIVCDSLNIGYKIKMYTGQAPIKFEGFLEYGAPFRIDLEGSEAKQKIPDKSVCSGVRAAAREFESRYYNPESKARYDKQRIIDFFKSKSASEIDKIGFHYKDLIGYDLFEALEKILSKTEYDNLFSSVSNEQLKAAEKLVDSNVFIYNYQDDGLNDKLKGIYDQKGHLVFFVYSKGLPEKAGLDSILSKLKAKSKKDNKRGYYTVLVYNSENNQLSFEGNSPYDGNTQTHDYVVKKGLEKAQEAEITEPDEMVSLYVEAFIEYVDKVDLSRKGEVVKSLSVEFEKNSNGVQYRGLTRKFGNKLMINVKYPTRYIGSNIRVETSNQGGVLTFTDSNCEINYKLNNELFPKTKTYQLGKLELDDGSIDESSFVLYYHPPNYLADNLDGDSITVSILCNGDVIQTETKQITTYEPPIFMVHGLWPPTVGYKKLMPFLNRLYGEAHYFDYSDTNVEDLRMSAAGLKEFIDEKISYKEIQQRIKVGKVNIIAHSMGGVVARYYISDLGGDDEIGMLLTYGAPHIGTQSMSILLGAVPYNYQTEKFVADKQTLVDYDALTKALRSLPNMPSNYGGLGTAVSQLAYKSRFLREGISDFPTEKTKLVMYAGTKPFIPNVHTALVLATDLLEKFINVPPSMGDTLKGFVLSLTKKNSDGLVPVDSASWVGGPTGFNVIRRIVPKNHVSLSNHEALWYELIDMLKGTALSPDEKRRMIEAGSPVNIYVVDQVGNIVGKKGELREEIDNVKFIEYNENDENQQAIYIEGDESYSFVLEAFGNGSFSFSITDIQDSTMNTIYYSDVNITDKSKAFLSLDNDKYDLEFDYDGDGNVDRVIEPEFVDSLDLSEEELDFTKSFDVNMPVREKKTGNLVVPIAVISLILIIVELLIIKRKQNV